ncbi:hypothetical protein AB0D37_06825 [Streptomyces sp. NPDC048384]|uniref:hypothetical protein n=1 Tax=Streptomyces sp. NPDC048384 TaxID=3155487 RepID=UPI0034385F1C
MSNTEIKNCMAAARRPVGQVRIQHHDTDGRLTHTTTHPNLLSPTFWGDGRNAELSLTRPGYFPNERGA